MPARLIINADDFGLTPGINRAIVELHQAGVVTSATLMATGSAFKDAVQLALANPTLGVGCHLVFVDGMPLSHPESIPSLLGADGKHFRPSLLDFAQAALRNTIRPADLARETAAQIQRLQRAGIDVTHVDTHKHTHLLPPIARTILHIAQRCGISALRFPFEPQWSADLAHAPLTRRLSLALSRRFEPALKALFKPIASQGLLPCGTLGIAATGTLNSAILDATLSALCMGAHSDQLFELCCHPGYVDLALSYENTRLRATREAEYAALRHIVPEIAQHVHPPELIHYGNLGVPGMQRASHQFRPPTGYEKVF